MRNVIVTIPNLSAPGGVNFYWDALLPYLKASGNISIKTMEVGGYGKNIIAPFIELWRFYKTVDADIELVILNPSLGFKSFFRDAFFARMLFKRKKEFITFFHGWDLEFEKKVSQKFVKFFLWSYGKSTKIIVLAEEFKAKLLHWGYTGEVIIETTAVDNTLLMHIDSFKNVKEKQKTTILFMSRMVKEKGIYETIAAFKAIRESHDIELIIAGDGTELYDIKEMVKDDKDIIVKGHVIGSEKARILRNSDIYCLPSYTEGLPTTVLEAMAFGLTVITSPVGGLKDFFKDGKMGYFVNSRSSDEIAGKFQKLLSNKSLIEEMGIYNRKFANENLTAEHIAKRVGRYLNAGHENLNKK
ncbi:glycosyltransferase family 4 protein [Maribacter flavus]|nr:glycosyltransferase family 4 protein [Maribacter flavus]